MKKIILAVALSLSIFAAQAQTKTAPAQPAEKAPDEQDGLIKEYFSQIMGVALSTTSNVKLFETFFDLLENIHPYYSVWLTC